MEGAASQLRRGRGSAVDFEKFFRLLFGHFVLVLSEVCWVKFTLSYYPVKPSLFCMLK